VGSGGQREDDTKSSVAGISPHTTRLFGAVTPEPDNTLDPTTRATDPSNLNAPQRSPKEPLDTKRIRPGALPQPQLGASGSRGMKQGEGASTCIWLGMRRHPPRPSPFSAAASDRVVNLSSAPEGGEPRKEGGTQPSIRQDGQP